MEGWLSVRKAAEYCSVSVRTMREWLKQGLRHTVVRRKVLIRVSWVDDFLTQRERRTDYTKARMITEEILKDVA